MLRTCVSFFKRKGERALPPRSRSIGYLIGRQLKTHDFTREGMRPVVRLVFDYSCSCSKHLVSIDAIPTCKLRKVGLRECPVYQYQYSPSATSNMSQCGPLHQAVKRKSPFPSHFTSVRCFKRK